MSIKAFAAVVLTLFAFVCCGIPTPPSSVRAQIRLNTSDSQTEALNLLDTTQPAPFAPLKTVSFTCFFVNVMGTGIGNWDDNEGTLTANAGSSEFTLFSPTIDFPKGTVEFEVPNGSERIFQALGVVSTKTCPTKLTASDIANGRVFLGIFEIGRTLAKINGNINISITSAYNPLTAKDARIALDSQYSTLDTEAPTLSSAVIQASRSGSNVSLRWTQASDKGTPTDYLLYKLVSANSTSGLDTVAKAENATLVSDWALGTLLLNTTTSSSTIAYNVLVKDAAGNTSAYTPIQVHGLPSLSYEGVNGNLTLGVAVTLTPTTLNANGSPITSCSIKSGSLVRLPSWASISQTTCVISGTPDALASSTTVTLVATNSVGSSDDATLTIRVQSP